MSVSFKITPPVRPSASSSTSSSSIRRVGGGGSGVDRRQQHHHDNDDDSDDNDETSTLKSKDELVLSFDRSGANKKHKDKQQEQLIIPSQPNRDWRRAAELSKQARLRAAKQRGQHVNELYKPESLNATMSMTSKRDGGGSTRVERDVIGDEPVVGGLTTRPKPSTTDQTTIGELDDDHSTDEDARQGFERIELATPPPPPTPPQVTDEQRALNELLSTSNHQTQDKPTIEMIQSQQDTRMIGTSEQQAFQRDVDLLPNESSLQDYERIPVGEFGLAMLRGMGWKPGQSISKNGKKIGPVEAYVPTTRPSMLGIGAKPMSNELIQSTSSSDSKRNGSKSLSKREQMKFMPLIKRESLVRNDSESRSNTPVVEGTSTGVGDSRSATPSTTSSSKYDHDYSQRRQHDRDRDRDRDRGRDPSFDKRRHGKDYHDQDGYKRKDKRLDEPSRYDSKSSRHGYRDTRRDEEFDRYSRRDDESRRTRTRSSSPRRRTKTER
ncbi:DNA primase large subunit Spp2 [Microbotryomycetes sp. JL221]|nr:DNA primase large subunit Spp2 [Microbotryomycetes sp. JL221]